MQSLVAVSARRALGTLLHGGMSAALLGALGSAAPALACPRCAAGIAARSQLWSQGVAFNLLSALAPFLVIGAVCLWFERSERP